MEENTDIVWNIDSLIVIWQVIHIKACDLPKSVMD